MLNQEIEEVLAKTFSVDCSKIILKNRHQKYVGKGSIFQDNTGSLNLKVFVSRREKGVELVRKIFSVDAEPGTLIKNDEYFKLIATDINGRKWLSSRLLPNVTTGVDGSLVVTAKIYEMDSTIPIPITAKHPSVFMIFPYKGKFPFSISTCVEEKVHQKAVRSMKLNAAVFNTSDIEVLIQGNNSFLNITLTTKQNSFPLFIDMRITEVFQFILAQKMNWIYFQETIEDTQRFHIRSFSQDERKSNLYAPLGNSDIDREGEFKMMFESFLKFILHNKTNNFHPISSFIYSLIQAGQGSIEALGLTVSVSVEGILNTVFKDLKVSKRITKKEIRAFETWIEEGHLSGENKNRFKSYQAELVKTRAIDKLYKLEQMGIVEKTLVKSWNLLRNPSAHPDRSKKLEVEKYMKLTDAVLTLFYKLIFLKIGYNGSFKDYSSKGWKNGTFKGS